LLNDLFFSNLPTETSVEVNLGVVKMKHAVKNDGRNVENYIPTLQKEINELKKIFEEFKLHLKPNP
jgi:hypothetical protein